MRVVGLLVGWARFELVTAFKCDFERHFSKLLTLTYVLSGRRGSSR